MTALKLAAEACHSEELSSFAAVASEKVARKALGNHSSYRHRDKRVHTDDLWQASRVLAVIRLQDAMQDLRV